MLEDECHLLDVKIVGTMAVKDGTLDQIEFNDYVSNRSEIRNLECVVGDYQNKISLVHEAINSKILKNPEEETKIRNIYDPRLIELNNKMKEKVIIFIYIYNINCFVRS